MKKYFIAATVLTAAFTAGILTAMNFIEAKTVYYNFDTAETIPAENYKYSDIPNMTSEISQYIQEMSRQLNIDEDLVVSILLKENPELNVKAIHENANGTLDLGLMQLNDYYIWKIFVPSYWKVKEEFNPFNWKMNLFLAMHHIQYLKESLVVMDDVITAYNCGEGATMRREIPDSTKSYLAAVKTTYQLLKKEF